jgi:hypothetical protein
MTDPRKPALRPRSSSHHIDLREAALQADTASRAAADVLSFGQADRVAAAGDATIGIGGPGNWRQRYRTNLERETVRNVYDAVHRGMARRTGEVAGIGIGLAGGRVVGIEGSAALPIKAKGLLGEVLSAGKTVLKGDWPVGFQVRRTLQNGAKTIVDHETAKGISVEAKFGNWARLSKNQRYAQKQWGPLYRVDMWKPFHVGRITGGVAAGADAVSAAVQDHQAGAPPRHHWF